MSVKHLSIGRHFVQIVGEPQAPAVLWIHGLGESGLCFSRLAQRPELAAWRHIIPDLSGYGRSLHPDEPYPLEDVADHLRDLMDECAVEQAVAAGHSLGGAVATRFAERFPHRVRAVADIEGNKSLGDCSFSNRARWCDQDRFVREVFPELCDSIYRGGHNDPALRGYYASLRLCDPRVWRRHARDLADWSQPEDLARRLDALSIASIVFCGVESRGGLCRRSRELLAATKVPVTCFTASGHWPFIDQEDDFVPALRSFLAGIG